MVYVCFFQRPIRLPPEENEAIQNVVLHCRMQVNDQNLWNIVKNHDYEDSDQFRKFFFCGGTKLNLFSEEGLPNLDSMFRMFKDDDVRQVLKKCKENLKSENPVDTSYNFYTCYLKHSPVYLDFD